MYVFPDVLDLTLAALEQKTSSAVTPMYIPPHGCGHASDVCAALFQHHCKDIDGARQGPFHPSTGEKVREVQREMLSGWFMVNAAAFTVMADLLRDDIISNVADYGYQNVDLATGLFLGSFGLTRVSTPSARWCRVSCITVTLHHLAEVFSASCATTGTGARAGLLDPPARSRTAEQT